MIKLVSLQMPTSQVPAVEIAPIGIESESEPVNVSASNTVAATTSAIVSISDAGLVAHLATFNPATGYTENANQSSVADPDAVVNQSLKMIEVDNKKNEAIRSQKMETYTAVPTRNAEAALSALDAKLSHLQTFISQTRPELAKHSWDFVLKDGEIQITGNLSANDKKWLKGQLNGDPQVLESAQAFYSSMTTYYQYTTDNNDVRGGVGGGVHYYDNVANQINGKVGLKSLVQHFNDLGGRDIAGAKSFNGVLDYARSYLVSSSTPPQTATQVEDY